MTENDNNQQLPNPSPLAGPQGLPAQGAAPGQAPPAVGGGILAGTGLDGIVAGYLQHITEVQANSPLGQKNKAIQDAKKAQDAAPVDTTKPAADPDAPAPAAGGGDQPRPGSFGGKLSSAVGEVAAGFGDAAHAHDTKGGWLSGVANTLNARNERLAQAKKDDILMAKTQAETIALHRNAFRQSAADAEEFHKGNQHFTETMDLNHNNSEASFDEVQKKMKDPNFARNNYVREIASDPQSTADGKPKKDKFGDPVTSPRYVIIEKATKDGSPDTHTVDAGMSAHMEQFYGTKMPVGTKLTTGQFVAMDTTMQADRMAVNHLNNGREKPLSADEIRTLRPALTDPTIQAAISHKPGDPYGGVQEQIANGNAHVAIYQKDMADAQAEKNQPKYDWAKSQLADVQEEHEKLKQFAADAFTEKQVGAYEKKQDDFGSMISDLQKKADGAHGEDAASMAASVKARLDDPNENFTDKQKQAMNGIITQTTAAAKASQEFKTTTEKNKMDVSNALDTEDVPVLIKHAFAYDVDPNQLFTMRKNTRAKFDAELFREADKQGIHWSEAEYKQRYNMNMDLAKDTPKSMGGQVDSLNRFAFHTGAANRAIGDLRNINSPAVNIPLNKLKSGMEGFPEAQAFMIKAETVKGEFLNFINNGFVPASDEEERVAATVNRDRTPAELQQTFRSMAELVAARGKGMNGRYNKIMGGKDASIPGLLQPDSERILRQFGVDVDAITKPNEVTSFSDPINPTQKVGSKTVQVAPTAPKGATHPMVVGKTPIWLVNNAWVTADGKPYKAQ
jgi:hypothetical protein